MFTENVMWLLGAYLAGSFATYYLKFSSGTTMTDDDRAEAKAIFGITMLIGTGLFILIHSMFF